MSQLRQITVPSSGKPAPSSQLSWPDFVQLVLELTVMAYRAMNQDRIASIEWEENVFTLCLGEDYIRLLAFDKEIPIRAVVRPKAHTDQMRGGMQATIEANEIDLELFDIWEREHHKRHFVWEAKRVGDKRINRAYSKLNSEYVNEGVYRFIRREYADGLDDAGMLGYVLEGEIPTIVTDVTDINASMGAIRKNPPLPTSSHLRMVQPIANFEDVYRSRHIRTDDTRIQIHHLFLTFDYT